MELLYSFKVRWGRVNVERDVTKLMYETGFAYMRKRETIPLKNISSVSAAALAPTVIVKTTDGHELKISVGSASERDKFYAALQGAVGRGRELSEVSFRSGSATPAIGGVRGLVSR